MDKERETLIRYLFGTLGDRETVNLEQQLKNDIEFQERFSLIQQEFSEVSGTLSIQNTNRETSSSPFTLQKESSALKSPAVPP